MYSHISTYKAGTVKVLILQMGRLRPRKVKTLAQGHTVTVSRVPTLPVSLVTLWF